MHASIQRLARTTAAALVLAPALAAAQAGPLPPGQQPPRSGQPGTPSTTPRPQPAPPPAPQGPTAGGPAGQGGQSTGDMPAEFRKQLDQLHSRNLGAVHVANIAQQRAQAPQVKDLARRISSERTMIDDGLRQHSKAHGYTLGEPSEAERKASMDVQSQMQQGEGFDLQYVEVALRDAMQDEQLLKDLRGAVPGKDATFKKWLDDAENVLESHVTAARQAKEAVRGAQRQARTPPSQ